ncbi:MAG: (deoxy)nucleoside triphosphate pyrophosphohydrolase [Bryobacteraceae bacterium]
MRGRRTMVVAALIELDGRYLIGQRHRRDRHAYKWEFPGGKVENGESPREALVRELREELGIEAVIGREISRYEHRVVNRPPLLLIFLHVQSYSGEPVNIGCFEQIRWEVPERLPEYDFLDGDRDFIQRLVRGEFGM